MRSDLYAREAFAQFGGAHGDRGFTAAENDGFDENFGVAVFGKFIVAEITTNIRAIPVEVRLGRREGLPSSCVANLDNVRTVARQGLDSRAGALAPSRHREVKRALGYALGWDELIDLNLSPYH